MRTQLELDNTTAAELAGSGDSILRALDAHLGCDVFLRGNVLTLDGDEASVAVGSQMVQELSQLVAKGHELDVSSIEAVSGALGEQVDPVQVLDDVVWRYRNSKVAPKTVHQKRYVDSIRSHTVTFGIGPAGTGKTFLAVAAAAAALQSREVNRIILTRPAVEAGERLGFLPGDLMAKVDPYLRPLFDALHTMLEPEKVAQHLERGVIEVAPLAYMRGRTLNDSFIILDEAQNTTPEQMKMFLTRLGFGSKMVVTGDVSQVDLPREQQSGLIAVSEILDGVEGLAFVRFGEEDVVRHKMVRRIVAAYDEHDQRQTAPIRSAKTAWTSETGMNTNGLDIEVLGSQLLSTGDPIPLEVRELCVLALASAGIEEGHLAVEFVGADRIHELNREYRDKDAPTDVLSFGVDEDGDPAGPRELGDIVICPEHTTDLREAIIHGTLHLTGMDHEVDEGQMLALQAELVRWIQT